MELMILGYVIGVLVGFFFGWFIAKSYFLKRKLFICSECGDVK